MKEFARPYPTIRTNYFFLVILTATIGLCWYATSCGLLLTYDSHQYMAAAQSFHAKGVLQNADGSAYQYWTPLFPVLLSLFSNPMEALRWVHLAALVLIGIFFLLGAMHFFTTPFFRLVFLATVLLNTQLVLIFSFVWSELLFLCLGVLHFYFVLFHHRKYFLAGIALSGFLLCLQRNAGLFWVAGSCAWLLFDLKGTGFKKIGIVATLFMLTTLGWWYWNIGNSFFTDTDFRFYEHRYLDHFWTNLGLAAQSIVSTVAPVKNIPFAAPLVVILFVAGFFLWRQLFQKFHWLAVCILFFYTLGFVSLGSLERTEMDRYLSVVAPLVMLLFLSTAGLITSRIAKEKRIFVLAALLAWSIYPVARTIKNTLQWHQMSCLMETPK